jgi:hypothetical protein
MSQDHIQIKTMQMANALLLPEVVRILNEGHTVTLPLRGYSMRPFLENGRDKALLKAIEQPQVGDAVLAEIAEGHFVLHRIIRIEGDHVTLRGDGNLGDEHCRLANVKAKAIGFYRKGRTHLDRTDGRKWKVYSWIWMRLTPIRRYLLAFYRYIWLNIFRPKPPKQA